MQQDLNGSLGYQFTFKMYLQKKTRAYSTNSDNQQTAESLYCLVMDFIT